MLGMSDGAERLHYLLGLSAESPVFLYDVEAALPFSVRNPLYSILHEACYTDGCATRWSAARVQPVEYECQAEVFTGEHVFEWNFEESEGLATLREAAQLLAERPWPQLYDPERLRSNQVPCAAAIYAEDVYVERRFSTETAGAH
jgi:hypothetical protein